MKHLKYQGNKPFMNRYRNQTPKHLPDTVPVSVQQTTFMDNVSIFCVGFLQHTSPVYLT